MKQAELGLNLTTKRTRKREFLAQIERVVPWSALVALIAPFAPEGRKGRPPFALATMLRIHFMQQWFTLSDPAMEEALHDMPLFREFAQLDWNTRLPDESTILRFRHLLEKHKLAEQMLALINDLLREKGLMLKAGTVVDATLIAAPNRIALDPTLFAALLGGTTAGVDSDEFRSSAGGNAADANDFMLFDSATGSLYYDADGNGAGAKVLFAVLSGLTGTLDYTDFTTSPPPRPGHEPPCCSRK